MAISDAKKCRLRWFKSRGAALILLWNVCTTVATVFSIQLVTNVGSTVTDKVLSPTNTERHVLTTIAGVVVLILFVLSAPLSGWLADAKFGNYRVFKFGSRLFFCVVVIYCPVVLTADSIQMSGMRFLPLDILLAGIGVLVLCGFIAYFTVSLQLGLDQLYDASSESITSFIYWYTFSSVSGIWIGISLYLLLVNCGPEAVSGEMIASLLPVIFMSIVLCSDFILTPKWLTIEPKSPQSLKNIFRVLKFAAKHKAPINRSALTYWEENIPSRLDLGKRRYGGPFTTKQVEDVKTFLKLLVMFLPLLLTIPALIKRGIGFPSDTYIEISNTSMCETILLYDFTYSPFWCDILAAILYEFLIYPLLGHKLPKLIKCIVFASFLTVVLNIANLSWTISVSHINGLGDYSDLFHIAYQPVGFCIFHQLLTSAFGFTCAQSPYSMRGVLFGYTVTILAFSIVISGVHHLVFLGICHGNCPIARYSVYLAMAILGFILHYALARWYKMREREDIDCTQALVEKTYERYLDQAERIQRRRYQQETRLDYKF